MHGETYVIFMILKENIAYISDTLVITAFILMFTWMFFIFYFLFLFLILIYYVYIYYTRYLWFSLWYLFCP